MDTDRLVIRNLGNYILFERNGKPVATMDYLAQGLNAGVHIPAVLVDSCYLRQQDGSYLPIASLGGSGNFESVTVDADPLTPLSITSIKNDEGITTFKLQVKDEDGQETLGVTKDGDVHCRSITIREDNDPNSKDRSYLLPTGKFRCYELDGCDYNNSGISLFSIGPTGIITGTKIQMRQDLATPPSGEWTDGLPGSSLIWANNMQIKAADGTTVRAGIDVSGNSHLYSITMKPSSGAAVHGQWISGSNPGACALWLNDLQIRSNDSTTVKGQITVNGNAFFNSINLRTDGTSPVSTAWEDGVPGNSRLWVNKVELRAPDGVTVESAIDNTGTAHFNQIDMKADSAAALSGRWTDGIPGNSLLWCNGVQTRAADGTTIRSGIDVNGESHFSKISMKSNSTATTSGEWVNGAPGSCILWANNLQVRASDGITHKSEITVNGNGFFNSLNMRADDASPVSAALSDGVPGSSLLWCNQVQVRAADGVSIKGKILNTGAGTLTGLRVEDLTLDALTRSDIDYKGQFISHVRSGDTSFGASAVDGANGYFSLSLHPDGGTRLTTSGNFYINGQIVPVTVPSTQSVLHNLDGCGIGNTMTCFYQRVNRSVTCRFKTTLAQWTTAQAGYISYLVDDKIPVLFRPEYEEVRHVVVITQAGNSSGYLGVLPTGNIEIYQTIAKANWNAGQACGIYCTTMSWTTAA